MSSRCRLLAVSIVLFLVSRCVFLREDPLVLAYTRREPKQTFTKASVAIVGWSLFENLLGLLVK